MANSRFELQSLLEKIPGVANVYFQPPSNIQLRYPCIIYKRSSNNVRYADNRKFFKRRSYEVTVIDRNPDSPIAEFMESLSYCRFDRVFATDSLYHFVYTLYLDKE